MGTFRRIFFYFSLAAVAVLIALVTSVFLFKDRIINQFIREANKQLNTPVKVAKIDISMFENFPQLAIVLNDVYIEDSHEGQYPLLTAKKISFQLNPIEVWKGTYTIKGLRVSDSETHLKINDQGKNNYTIVKEGGNGSKGAVSFELKNVKLENTKVHYTDLKVNENLVFTSKNLDASIHSSENIYDIEAKGELTTELINVNGNSFLNGKSFAIDSDLIYDDIRKKLTINPSILRLKNSDFTVSGNYHWKDKNLIDLSTEAKDADIQTIISLLPESVSRNLEKYRSKGEVYFKSNLKGEISRNKNPSFSVDFGFTNATIFHPDYKSRIREASVSGSFATTDVLKATAATLVLKNIKGKLNEEPFSANFVIHDFENPDIICDFKGRIDAASLLGFYPVENIKTITGSILADVAMQGKVEFLKKKTTAQKVSTRGTIELQNINFTYEPDKIPFHNLNGTLQFNNNDLALSNVSARIGKSDFLFNGFFKNIITFLLFDDQPIGIEADLKSHYLDVDQLLAIAYGKPDRENQQKYEFSISKNVYLNFNCDVNALRYRRFSARQIKGDLLVKNQVAVSRNLGLRTMGGNISLSGIVDATNKKAIDVVFTNRLTGIHLDSAFYVFENFDQNFIEDRHLKGQATADVDLELALNENLKLFPETLVADISAVIKNGELNNFEPLKKLNKYLDDEGLSELRFSDLQNDIHIENKTIYIPQMEVRSNVTDIKISGTHTFDQHIDYRLITPLRGKRKISSVDSQGAVENDGSGQSKLFLKIIGTADDYRVAYDTDAVKKKIVSDLKKEVRELKEAFKTKGEQKKKEIEVQEDEYFDWEEEER